MTEVEETEIKGCDIPDGCADPQCGWCANNDEKERA